ncbi:MAG: DUF1330 domain-containing protein [Pseudomonadales bacterium]|jgi:uncharacterized protein (DUF1330 family)|tara:strand:+ start:190 stop:564 length:375 start_codon:yes stop_codon:yes gene_type:complete
MSDSNKPAYLVVCGTTLGGAADPRYGELAAPAAEKANLTMIAFGEMGSEKVKVLEGELPAGVTFTAVEQFTSMAALEVFWFSDAYQAAIPFRKDSVKMNFVVALDGISEAEREAQRQAYEEGKN